jgi:hypothetical protein
LADKIPWEHGAIIGANWKSREIGYSLGNGPWSEAV